MSFPMYKIKIRINESGISFFLIDANDVKRIIINAMLSAPVSVRGEKHTFKTPETTEAVNIITASKIEPYFSSCTGPKSRINAIFYIK